jgi:hypothetical protein
VHSERRSDRIDPLASFAPEPMGGRPEPRPESRPEPRSEPMPLRATSRNEPMMPRPLQRPVEAPKPTPIRAPERAAAPPPPAPAPIPMPPAQSAADQNLAEMAQRLEAALRRPAGGDAGEPRIGAPPVAPEPPSSRAAPRIEPSITPTAAPTPAPAPAKTGFENLEDEMASLLGRPKSPS